MTKKGMNAKKALLASMIMVMLFAAFPITSALAASGTNANNNANQDWKRQLNQLRFESTFLNQFRILPAQFLMARTAGAQQANFKNGFTVVVAAQQAGIPVTGGTNSGTGTSSSSTGSTSSSGTASSSSSSSSSSSATGTTNSSGTTTVTSGQQQVTMTFASRTAYKKWTRMQYMLSQYLFAMRQAQALAATHLGFDANGTVINQDLANQTTQQMAMYLGMMRKIRQNLNDL